MLHVRLNSFNNAPHVRGKKRIGYLDNQKRSQFSKDGKLREMFEFDSVTGQHNILWPNGKTAFEFRFNPIVKCDLNFPIEKPSRRAIESKRERVRKRDRRVRKAV